MAAVAAVRAMKRIRFGTRGHDCADFASAWRDAVGAALAAPADARPVRVAVCTVLTDVTPDPRHDGIGIEWFTDVDHVRRFDDWLRSPDAASVDEALGRAIDVAASPVVVAEEHAMRGQEWLAERWRDAGPRLKHMAIARRATGLTLPAFLDLWQRRAGTVGATPIPDAARGQAYVQNRPLVGTGVEWEYDALTEVYFDDGDLAGLRTRIDFFAETMQQGGEDDLVAEHWFVAASEEVLAAP